MVVRTVIICAPPENQLRSAPAAFVLVSANVQLNECASFPLWRVCKQRRSCFVRCSFWGLCGLFAFLGLFTCFFFYSVPVALSVYVAVSVIFVFQCAWLGSLNFVQFFFVVVYLDCALLKRIAEFSASLVLLFVLLDSDVALLTWDQDKFYTFRRCSYTLKNIKLLSSSLSELMTILDLGKKGTDRKSQKKVRVLYGARTRERKARRCAESPLIRSNSNNNYYKRVYCSEGTKNPIICFRINSWETRQISKVPPRALEIWSIRMTFSQDTNRCM